MPKANYPSIPLSTNIFIRVKRFHEDLKYELEEQLFKLVLDNYKDKLSQVEMAKMLGMNVRTFRTKLKEIRGRYEKNN